MVVKIGINGFGTIGRRVADAVALQPDMKLVGIVKTRPDYKTKIAIRKNCDVYSSDAESMRLFEKEGVPIKGTLNDLLKEVDIIVEAAPKGVGERNKPIYEKAGVKAIFEGGEKARVADVSFVAQCNYDKAYGKRFVRSVSCNTTGICRTLHAIDGAFGVKKARVVLVRRAVDPDDIKRGPVNAIVPDPITLPSHHGPDVNTVLPELPIVTVALKVPSTHIHVHSLSVELKSKNVSEKGVVDVFEKTPRVVLISGDKDNIRSTGQVIDWARDLGRSRGDVYEACVWSDSISMVDGELYYFQAIHSEAIVVPENMDAIRASLKIMSRDESIKKTDRALNVLSSW